MTWCLLIVACAAGPRATTVLSIRNLSCRDCGDEVVTRLRGLRGVREASFNADRVEVSVVFDANVTAPARLRDYAAGAGEDIVLGAGHGTYAPDVVFPAAADVRWISRAGADVDLDAHRAAGRVTVYDFSAEWCGPCRDVARELLEQVERRPDLAIRRIDVGEWGSPVARHHLANVTSLPYLIIVGRDGARRAVVAGADLPRLRREIDEAMR